MFTTGAIGIILVLLFLLGFSFLRLWETSRQLKKAVRVMDDIQSGNHNRRIVVPRGNMAAELCFKLNETVIRYKEEITKHEQGEETYKQLVTSLSHDIRTPLSSISGYLEAASTGLVEADEKDDYILIAYNKAVEMNAYLNNLFEFLKLESGERTYHIEQLDLCALIRECLAGWIPELDKKAFEYELCLPAEPIVVPLDRNSFCRIFDNLLQNAVAHSGGSSIQIGAQPTAEAALFWVKDNGAGIDERHLPRLFERLYRADKARTGPGSGLGLAIVFELAKAHGGSVAVKNQSPKGACFTVEFPVRQL